MTDKHDNEELEVNDVEVEEIQEVEDVKESGSKIRKGKNKSKPVLFSKAEDEYIIKNINGDDSYFSGVWGSKKVVVEKLINDMDRNKDSIKSRIKSLIRKNKIIDPNSVSSSSTDSFTSVSNLSSTSSSTSASTVISVDEKNSLEELRFKHQALIDAIDSNDIQSAQQVRNSLISYRHDEIVRELTIHEKNISLRHEEYIMDKHMLHIEIMEMAKKK